MVGPTKARPAPTGDKMTIVHGVETIGKEKHAGGRPPKFATPEELQAAVDAYFDSCWTEKITEATDTKTGVCTMSTVRYQSRPYTIMGLALALDLSRQGLCEYADKGDFSDIVKKAKAKVEMNVEELLLDGKGTGPIFWLKNHAGYKDQQEVKHSGEFIHKVERVVIKPK